MPISHFRRYVATSTGVPRWRNRLPGHPISSEYSTLQACVICGYRHLAKRPCSLTTVWDSYATLCHLVVERPCTSIRLMSPYYTERRPSHNLIYTVDYTFRYRSKKYLCACLLSSTHAHGGSKIGGTDLKHFKTSVGRTRSLRHWLTSLQTDIRQWSKVKDVSPKAGHGGW